MLVSDIMTKKVTSVGLETSIKEIARLLIKNDFKGVPVVDENKKVVGIITECDLILQNANLHLPTFIQILDGVIALGQKETEEELRRMTGAVAKEVMSQPPICVTSDSSVEELANIMWEKKINPVPVVDEGRLVGIVSRADIVKLIARD